MPAKFEAPGVLYLSSSQPDRAYVRSLLPKLREAGYERYVEPCVGGFGTALEASAIGWPHGQIETSDVSLYSAVLGYVAAGRDLIELNVRVDDEPIPLAGEPYTDGALILYAHLLLRYGHRSAVYWQEITRDLEHRRDSHVSRLRTSIEKMHERLAGIGYESLDLFDHIERVAGDAKTVIVSDPPVYKAGYEKMMSTAGRVTWDEPPYRIFDPEVGFQELRELMADKPALLLCGEATGQGKSAHPRPVYARHAGPDHYVYCWSNRPEEILVHAGGLRVIPRPKRVVQPLDVPLIPPDHEITPDSHVEIRRIEPGTAGYYKDMWLHKVTAADGNYSSRDFALVVDGYLAGIAGVDGSPMYAPSPGFVKAGGDGEVPIMTSLLLRYGICPPHRARLTRLLTLVTLSRPLMRELINEPWATIMTHGVTVQYTRYPESKDKRGLMKLARRDKVGEGYKLLYMAPIHDEDAPELIARWRKKEDAWQQQRLAATASR